MRRTIYLSLIFTALFTFVLSETTTAQTTTSDYYNVKTGNGKGLRFWSSNHYKIHMGATNEYKYGPVTGYSIKNNMYNLASRGWTWGSHGATPVAALNTQGNFQIKGWMKIESDAEASEVAGTGGLEIDGTLRFDGNEIVTNTNQVLYIQTANNGDLRIDDKTLCIDASANRTGVGVSYPLHKFHVQVSGSDGIRLAGSNNGNIFYEIDNGGGTHSMYDHDLDGHTFALESANDMAFNTNGTSEKMRILENGNVGIGTDSPDNKLDVYGTVRALEVKVQSGWSDYVFYDDYQRPTLLEEEKNIQEKGHLLGFESEETMDGMIQLGDVTRRQQAKIEEVILHLIDMEKEITQLKKENEELKKKLSDQ